MLNKKDRIGLVIIFLTDLWINFPLLGGLTLGGCIILCFIMLIFIMCKRKFPCRDMIGFGVIILLEVVLVLGWNKIQLNYAQHQGKKIVLALEFFRDRSGYYPGKLQELVPEYLDRIPRSKIFYYWGTSSFSYGKGDPWDDPGMNSKSSSVNYYLVFQDQGWSYNSYDRTTDKWLVVK